MTTTATPGATLRPANAADLPLVEALLADARLPLEGVREALSTFVVAEHEGALVGVAGLEIRGEHALLRSVAVAPEWRSRGVGRALVTRVIGDAEARGIRALYLLTTTAEGYFPTFGFRRIERERVPDEVRSTAEFTTACPASATVMCRECAAGPHGDGRYG